MHQWKKAKKEASATLSDFFGIVSGPHIHVLENGSLAIIDADKMDEGEYLCESSNGIGSILTASIKIIVHTPAYFLKNFEVISAFEEQRAHLLCEVHGDPAITIKWSKERELLSNSQYGSQKHVIQENEARDGDGAATRTSRLSIESLEVADSSFYACAASNQYGSDEKNFQLIVQGPPGAPLDLKTREVKSRHISIGWTEPANGNSPLQSYLVHYKRNNGIYKVDTESFKS